MHPGGMSREHAPLGAMLLTCAALACAQAPAQLHVTARPPRGAGLFSVAQVSLSVSAPDLPQHAYALSSASGAWTAIFSVPAGADRSFTAEARDAGGALLFSASKDHVQVDPGAALLLDLLLQQATSPAPFQDTAPRIDSFLVANDKVTAGHALSLAVTASHPGGGTLDYLWTAPDGAFSAQAAQTEWTAPLTAGPRTLEIAVTDALGVAASASAAIVVVDAPSAPTISTGPAFGPGASASASVTAHDGMSYSWSASGAVITAGQRESTVTFTVTAPDTVTLTCAEINAAGDSASASVQVPVQ